MGRKLLKTVQTITTFRNPLGDPLGTRRGPPLVRGPQFENRWHRITKIDNTVGGKLRRYDDCSIKCSIYSAVNRIPKLNQIMT